MGRSAPVDQHVDGDHATWASNELAERREGGRHQEAHRDEGPRRPDQIVDPDGRTFSYRYDGNGDLVRVVDPLGAEWVQTGAAAHDLLVGDVDSAARAYAAAAERFTHSPAPLMGRACVHVLRNAHADALAAEAACVDRFPHVSPASRAVLAALLGNRERLLSLLTQARARRDMDLPQAAIHPALDAYVRDAEVQRLLPLGCFVGLR